MNYLVAWTKCQVKEGSNWDTRQEVALGENVAYVMHLVNRVGGSVHGSLETQNIDILAVVDNFACEWHIL